MLVNEQSLATIMGRMPATDWKQWVMDRLYWVKDPKIPSAFEKFVEQKWKSVAVAAAEPVGWGHLCLNQSRQCCWQGKKMKFRYPAYPVGP